MKTHTFTTLYQECQPEELTPGEQQLVRHAARATGHSYVPYSHFAVGAALLLDDGTIVEGCNQENAAFPAGLCAERSAIFAAGASLPDTPPVALAIAARRLPDNSVMPQQERPTDDLMKELQEEPVSPCGTCRQVIIETEKRYGRQLRLLLVGRGKVYVIDGIKQLMPLCFTDF